MSGLRMSAVACASGLCITSSAFVFGLSLVAAARTFSLSTAVAAALVSGVCMAACLSGLCMTAAAFVSGFCKATPHHRTAARGSGAQLFDLILATVTDIRDK